ncbi:MAG: hypothetical protein M3R24_06745 [Chloroflexota bacterium]|nr:hypothetical protein [Chloroflexota bacterium]
MLKTLAGKSLEVQQAANRADDLLLVLSLLPEVDVLRTRNKMVWTAANDLIQSEEPDVLLLGFLMCLNLVTSVPAQALGETLHAVARQLHAVIAAEIEEPEMSDELLLQLLPAVQSHIELKLRAKESDEMKRAAHKEPNALRLVGSRRQRTRRQRSVPTPRKFL